MTPPLINIIFGFTQWSTDADIGELSVSCSRFVRKYLSVPLGNATVVELAKSLTSHGVFFLSRVKVNTCLNLLATKEPRSKFVVDEVNLSGNVARFYPESPKLDYQFFNPDVLSWEIIYYFSLVFFRNIKNLNTDFNVTADTQLQWLEAPTLSEARALSLDCFNSRGGFPRNNKARSFNCP